MLIFLVIDLDPFINDTQFTFLHCDVTHSLIDGCFQAHIM